MIADEESARKKKFLLQDFFQDRPSLYLLKVLTVLLISISPYFFHKNEENRSNKTYVNHLIITI